MLDHGRQTSSTTWLDGEPIAISQMPSESIAPLLVAMALFIFFIAMVFSLLWMALAGVILTFAGGCFWLWPREPQEQAA